MSEPIPPALRRAGIVSVSDNLPDGAGIDFASAFVRIFREEIEEKLYGWRRPVPAITRPIPKSEK